MASSVHLFDQSHSGKQKQAFFHSLRTECLFSDNCRILAVECHTKRPRVSVEIRGPGVINGVGLVCTLTLRRLQFVQPFDWKGLPPMLAIRMST